MNNFFNKWGNFLQAFLSPVPSFSIFVALILMYVSISKENNKEFSILANVIGSIFLAIAGAFIKGGYDELVGESILVKKGKSAIRNLNSISGQVVLIKNWIETFVKKDSGKRELEEVHRHLETMTMNINSGSADWIDIVPELRESGEVAKSFESTVKAYIEEIFEKKKELLKVGENKELKKQLEEKIKELEKEVKNLGRPNAGLLSNTSIVQSSPLSVGTINPSNFFVCQNCGRSFMSDITTDYLTIPLCPNCKKGTIG